MIKCILKLKIQNIIFKDDFLLKAISFISCFLPSFVEWEWLTHKHIQKLVIFNSKTELDIDLQKCLTLLDQ